MSDKYEVPVHPPSEGQIYELTARLANEADPAVLNHEKALFGEDLASFIERIVKESRYPRWDSQQAFADYEIELFGRQTCEVIRKALEEAKGQSPVPAAAEAFSRVPAAEKLFFRESLSAQAEVPVINNIIFSAHGRIGRLFFVVNSAALTLVGSFVYAVWQETMQSYGRMPDFNENDVLMVAGFAVLFLLGVGALGAMNWVKRLRDLKKDPVFLVLFFVPLLNFFFWFYLALAPSVYGKINATKSLVI